MPVPSPAVRYHFGPFDLYPAEGSLSRNGTRVKLQDLPYRLLLMLVERPGEIVTREEVRQRLWPKNTFVEFDNSLGVAIRKVRDCLGDDAEAPRYIETIPRRGYRFRAPVTVQGPAREDAAEKLIEKETGGALPAAATPIDRVPTRAHPVSRFAIVAFLALLLLGGSRICVSLISPACFCEARRQLCSPSDPRAPLGCGAGLPQLAGASTRQLALCRLLRNVEYGTRCWR
jgi:DNA-binding winged helix-turn-helix (wHTH) protein